MSPPTPPPRLPRVFFATRSPDWRVHTAYADCMLRTVELLHREGIPCTVRILNGGNINLAQNRLVAAFRQSGASHFFAIDADMAWEPESALRLIRHGVDVVGCNYPKRERAPNPKFQLPPQVIPAPVHVNWILRDGQVARDAKTGLLEVSTVMGGFLCVTREAIDRLYAALAPDGVAPGGDTLRTRAREGTEDVVMLFDSTIDEHGGHSDENPTFCTRWRAVGGTVWLDPWGRFEHLGPASYAAPSVAEMMGLPAFGAPAEAFPITIGPAAPTPRSGAPVRASSGPPGGVPPGISVPAVVVGAPDGEPPPPPVPVHLDAEGKASP